jgi:hypothetical protein
MVFIVVMVIALLPFGGASNAVTAFVTTTAKVTTTNQQRLLSSSPSSSLLMMRRPHHQLATEGPSPATTPHTHRHRPHGVVVRQGGLSSKGRGSRRGSNSDDGEWGGGNTSGSTVAAAEGRSSSSATTTRRRRPGGMEVVVDHAAAPLLRDKNPIYSALATAGRDDQERRPNGGNTGSGKYFFYNDEVMSHLYGYVYLVGFLAARDALFVGTFFMLSTLAAAATDRWSVLPANPRVPAIVALLTFATTYVIRYGFGIDETPFVRDRLLEGYEGPTDSAFFYELIVCLLNGLWGFWGTWRTKEPVDGATHGF